MTNKKAYLVFALIFIFPLVSSQILFDSFWLVQQWPPAVCNMTKGKCVRGGLHSFTIHGLWPQKGGTSVTQCHGKWFKFNEISHLKTDLDRVWPDVILGKNINFWKHEWRKHGVCSESKFNLTEYFQAAINMRNNIDLLGVLTVGGIVPDGTAKSKNKVESVLTRHFGRQPILRCKTINSNIMLVEIVLCYDDDGITLTNCNSSRAPSCNTPFIF